MTTSTDTIHADIATLIRKALPRWATVAQLNILTDRFVDGYEWGWICGDGSAGGAHSERGASRAASRAAGRAARRCSGPAPWTCVIDLDTAVGGTADDRTHAYAPTRTEDGGVRYWSVYEQVWKIAHSQSEIADREWAAHNDEERALFSKLPVETDDEPDLTEEDCRRHGAEIAD
jgi:hypothetical protein